MPGTSECPVASAFLQDRCTNSPSRTAHTVRNCKEKPRYHAIIGPYTPILDSEITLKSHFVPFWERPANPSRLQIHPIVGSRNSLHRFRDCGINNQTPGMPGSDCARIDWIARCGSRLPSGSLARLIRLRLSCSHFRSLPRFTDCILPNHMFSERLAGFITRRSAVRSCPPPPVPFH
jgi:hypothetical protein